MLLMEKVLSSQETNEIVLQRLLIPLEKPFNMHMMKQVTYHP